MISSDFRAEARRKLSGKWGKGAIIALAYFAIFFVLGFIEGLFPESVQSIISIIEMVIEIPLAFGLIYSFLKLFNEEDVKAFDFLSLGFNNFKKSWGVTFNIILKMIAPIILIIVSYVITAVALVFTATSSALITSSSSTSTEVGGILSLIGAILLIVSMIWGITKSYYYQLSYMVAAENPEMSSKEAVLKSEELMTGKRGKLFCLQLSFIGWIILATIPLCIGYLWLIPYIQLSLVSFYKFANGESSTNEVVSSDEIIN